MSRTKSDRAGLSGIVKDRKRTGYTTSTGGGAAPELTPSQKAQARGGISGALVGQELQSKTTIRVNTAANSIGNDALADMAQSTIKGRAAGAGTGDPQDLTPVQVVTILLAADGAGSLLDADLLDGFDSSAFPRKAEAATIAGSWAFDALLNLPGGSYVNADGDYYAIRGSNADVGVYYLGNQAAGARNLSYDGTNYYMPGASLFVNGEKVWTQGNDGAGSGLDADLLDGYSSIAFPRKDEAAAINGEWMFNETVGFGVTPNSSWGTAYPAIQLGNAGALWGTTGSTEVGLSSNIYINDVATAIRLAVGGTTIFSSSAGQFTWSTSSSAAAGTTALHAERMKLTNLGVLTVNGNTVWHQGNDGAGSGLDADLLDGTSWPAPGPIGATTASTGAFTSLSSTLDLLVRGATGGGDFAGTTGVAIGGANPGLLFQGTSKKWLNYILGNDLKWFENSAALDRMTLTSTGINSTAIGTTTPSTVKGTTLDSNTVVHASGAASYLPLFGQGAYLSWNRDGGNGRTDFINSRGGGAGGFDWYNGDAATQTLGMSLDSSNVLAIAGAMKIGAADRYYTALAQAQVSSTGDGGLVIDSGVGGIGRIFFTEDGTDANTGMIRYNHATDTMEFYTSNGTATLERMRLTTTGINSTAIGATTPSTGAFTTLTLNSQSVSLGAVDSGGAGFRVLRVPN